MSLNGVISNFAHYLTFRVAYQDTDAGGVMYHANYIAWAERARAALWFLFQSEEHMELSGQFQRDLEMDAVFVARKAMIEYLRPGKLYDEIKIETNIKNIGHTSLTFQHTFLRSDGKILAHLEIVLVYILRDSFKPTRLPEYWKTHFSELLSHKG